MTGRNKQSGFSLVEAMLAATILIVVFAGSFGVLSKVRTAVKVNDAAGPQFFFETFASARLRVYYSKLLQWMSHVGNNLCGDAALYAYASNNGNLGARVVDPNRTLGADMRMALSTLDYAAVDEPAETLVGRWGNDSPFLAGDPAPWGALVPFSSRDTPPDGLAGVNPSLSSFCDNNENRFSANQNNLKEFCAWVDVCSGQKGDRTASILLVPDVTAGGPLYLGASGQAGAIVSLQDQPNFRMCFAFVGNLFTETGNVTTLGRQLQVLEYPAVLGLVVADASFLNLDADMGVPLTCNEVINEMNRAMRIDATFYTVLNAHRDVASGRQQAFKSFKQLTAQKFGVPVPNCLQQPEMRRNGDLPVCIAAPLWLYSCDRPCATP